MGDGMAVARIGSLARKPVFADGTRMLVGAAPR
jgi:hypothetical protein